MVADVRQLFQSSSPHCCVGNLSVGHLGDIELSHPSISEKRQLNFDSTADVSSKDNTSHGISELNVSNKLHSTSSEAVAERDIQASFTAGSGGNEMQADVSNESNALSAANESSRDEGHEEMDEGEEGIRDQGEKEEVEQEEEEEEEEDEEELTEEEEAEYIRLLTQSK